MKTTRFAVLLLAAVSLVLMGCGGDEPREEPFVGQWESTGGSSLTLDVAAPVDGIYAVTFEGEGQSREMSATRVNDMKYKADNPAGDWVFNLVDEELMNVTILVSGESATTSFKRIGG